MKGGGRCGARPCWRALGATGYVYGRSSSDRDRRRHHAAQAEGRRRRAVAGDDQGQGRAPRAAGSGADPAGDVPADRQRRNVDQVLADDLLVLGDAERRRAVQGPRAVTQRRPAADRICGPTGPVAEGNGHRARSRPVAARAEPRREPMARVAQVVGLSVALSVFAVAPVAAAPPAQSLARCQRTVADEGQQFVTRVQQVVGRCLDAAAEESLRRERPVVDAAARACVNALAEIRSSRGELGLQARLEARMARWCVPGQPDVTHATADVLGTSPVLAQSIDARNLGALRRLRRRRLDRHGRGVARLRRRVTLVRRCDGDLHRVPAGSRVARRSCARRCSGRPGPRTPSPPSTSSSPRSRAAATCRRRCFPRPDRPSRTRRATMARCRSGRRSGFTTTATARSIDQSTGLVWEKKTDDGSLHDKDRAYAWEPGPGSIWEWLAAVNAEGGGFAGKNDWRIPNKKELESIVDASTFNPAFPAAFSSACTPGCGARPAAAPARCSTTGRRPASRRRRRSSPGECSRRAAPSRRAT